jgi:hypothetical protein
MLPAVSPERVLPNGYQFPNGLRIQSVLGRDAHHIYYRAAHRDYAWAFTVTENAPKHLCTRVENGALIPLEGKAHSYSGWLEVFVRLSRAYHSVKTPHLAELVTVWEGNGTAYRATMQPGGETLSARPPISSSEARSWLRALLQTLGRSTARVWFTADRGVPTS